MSGSTLVMPLENYFLGMTQVGIGFELTGIFMNPGAVNVKDFAVCQFLNTATEAFQLPNCQRRDDLFGHNGRSVRW